MIIKNNCWNRDCVKAFEIDTECVNGAGDIAPYLCKCGAEYVTTVDEDDVPHIRLRHDDWQTYFIFATAILATFEPFTRLTPWQTAEVIKKQYSMIGSAIDGEGLLTYEELIKEMQKTGELVIEPAEQLAEYDKKEVISNENPTVLQIIRSYMEDHGYDGLYDPGECACVLNDLMPCSEVQSTCRAGYEHKCEPESGCGCKCDYLVSSEKPGE